jgi:hypothetical protein
MNWLHRAVGMSLLALWLPAALHCKLENVRGLEFLRCASDTPTSSDCEGDSCQVVESGSYKIPENNQIVALPLFFEVVSHTSALVSDSLIQDICLRPPLTPPPELPKSWQFISRTALPVRAPSFAS